jgi:hypothetical protein
MENESGVTNTAAKLEELQKKPDIKQMASKIKVQLQHPLAQRIIMIVVFILVIFFVMLIVWIIYKVYNNYPRLRTIGHTEPLEDYMRQHVFLTVKNLHILRDFYSTSNNNDKLSVIVQELFSSDVVPENNLDEYTPLNAPFIYIAFMFKRALSGETNHWKKMELNLIKRLSSLETIHMHGKEQNIYNETETNVNDNVIEYIKYKTQPFFKLQDYFGQIDCSYKGQTYNSKKKQCDKSYKWCQQKEEYPEAIKNIHVELARKHLSLLTYRYAKQIEHMYDLRKSGGLGNFIVYNIYMSEYVQFVFNEQIPNTWNNFFPRVKATGNMYWNVVTSEPVANYMANIPLLLAGIDGFTNDFSPNHIKQRTKNDQNRKSLYNVLPMNDDEDVIEHFEIGGLGNLIKSLMMLIPNLLKIVMAFLELLSNPFKIVQLVIGLVLGVIIYIIYLVLAIIGPLFYIPAFFWILTFSLISTVAWLALFIALAIIYFILWILDWATNGFIFSLLRCETLPNAWHEIPGYIFDNFYNRGFLCSHPCRKNYLPAGFFCKRSNDLQPPYCPHQLIMNTFNLHAFNGKGSHNSLNDTNLFHTYKANIDYIKGDDKRKQEILSDFHDEHRKFSKKCDESMAQYNFLTSHICKNLDNIRVSEKYTDEEFDKLKTACHKCYCKYYYLNNNCRMSQKPFIRIIKTTQTLESKFIKKLENHEIKMIRNELQKDMNKASEPLKPLIRDSMKTLRTNHNEHVYMVNDGFENDEQLKNKDLNRFIHNIPNSIKRYSFCDNIIDLVTPELQFQKRKKGMIVYYIIYASLILIMVVFGFMLLYDGIAGVKD